jgi:hypothetical protein
MSRKEQVRVTLHVMIRLSFLCNIQLKGRVIALFRCPDYKGSNGEILRINQISLPITMHSHRFCVIHFIMYTMMK